MGGFIPEFGRIVGKMQFNMYHSYTVDEHTLRAIGTLADPTVAAPEAAALLGSVMPLVADREALFLAMLLHDTGKGGEESQEVAGEKAAVPACLRMGLTKERAALVGWLVRHHLDMSDFAQKRDLSDPATVSAFARLVENPEQLRLLLALTVADIRAVGPGVFNGWKGQLLSELYRATEAVFRGGRGDDAAAHFREERAARAASAREAIPDCEGGPARLRRYDGGRIPLHLLLRRARGPPCAGGPRRRDRGGGGSRAGTGRQGHRGRGGREGPLGPLRRPRRGHGAVGGERDRGAGVHLEVGPGARPLPPAGPRRAAFRGGASARPGAAAVCAGGRGPRRARACGHRAAGQVPLPRRRLLRGSRPW